MYDKLVLKVNVIDTKIPSTSGLVTKTQYDSDKQRLEKKIEDVDKKIPSTCQLAKKTDCNTKITEIENKIPDITNLAIKATLNTKAAEFGSNLMLLIWLPRLLAIQKPQRLKTKYPMPQVLLLLLSSTD